MPKPNLSSQTTARRAFWVAEIRKLSDSFRDDAERMEEVLKLEIESDGSAALLDHLLTCGVIPESYGHDSSEEKLYSKYTDALIAFAFAHMGITSVVLKLRADSADVECVTPDFSFVADAKAFRLSRTAKNQKDFKVQAMDGWKRGKPFAIVVCPIYQLPARASQIYLQAISRDVCLFSYSHIALLVRLADKVSPAASVRVLHDVFKSVAHMHPTKDAVPYWTSINRTMLSAHKCMQPLWLAAKLASIEAMTAGKEEALQFLAKERETMMRMSRQEAINELISKHNIENRIQVIRGVCDNALMDIS